MGSHNEIRLQNQHPDVSVFIKNLNEATDSKTLSDIFGEFGAIVSCKLVHDEKGKSKGYAFVQFESEEAARAAVEKGNGRLIDDNSIFVSKFVPRRGRNTERDGRTIYTNLYVKNFGNGFNEDNLRQLFEPFGKIKSHAIMTNSQGHSRGFGFVAFEDVSHAEQALKSLNGKVMSSGHKLYVARAQKRAERQQELQRQFEEQEERKHCGWSDGLSLYVRNLDDNVTNERLRVEFSSYGPVTSAKVVTDSNGNSKGFGFVRFLSPVDACFAAAGLNGRMLGTKPLYVMLAQRNEEGRALQVSLHMRQRLQATESMYAIHNGIYAQHVSASRSQHHLSRKASAQFCNCCSPKHWPLQSYRGKNASTNGMHRSSPTCHIHGNNGYQGHNVRYVSSATSHQLPPAPEQGAPARAAATKSPLLPTPIKPPLLPTPTKSALLPTPTASPLLPTPNRSPLLPTPARSQLLSTPVASPLLSTSAASTLPMPVNSINPAGLLVMPMYYQYPNMGPISSSDDSIDGCDLPIGNEMNNSDDMDLSEDKQEIGERLYRIIKKIYPHDVAKITGMLLEMDMDDLLDLLEDDDALREKIDEAQRVYTAYISKLQEVGGSLNDGVVAEED